MKQLNPKLIERADRQQHFQTMRELRTVGVARAKYIHDDAKTAAELLPVKIVVPTRLKYYARRQNRRLVEYFFEDVNSSLRQGKRVLIDFSKVEALFPCGVLILMGWVDEWAVEYPGRVSANYPKVDLVEQMLQQVDVLQKLGLPSRKQIFHDDVTRWHYFHGDDADATPIEPFMLQLKDLLGEEQQLGLGNCVTEAMINVRHHAYEGHKPGPWWIFATVAQDKVFVALYDRGNSIPATLLSKPAVLDFLTARVWSSGRADGRLITAALGGRTRTQLPYRGKGLPEMLEFTKMYKNSELGIFSRRGFFRYDTQESTGILKFPIKGTLVIWMLNNFHQVNHD